MLRIRWSHTGLVGGLVLGAGVVLGGATPSLALGTLMVKFSTDPTWSNAPLSQNAAACKSNITVTSPPGGNQFPLDSIVTRFSGNVRAQLLGGASTAPIGGVLRRATLTQQEAAGTGLPGGFNGWPNPGVPGELTGMMWPMRDFLNFSSTQTIIPGGFDNSPRNGGESPGPTAILGIDGAQDVARYGRRTNIGNGITSPMNVFQLEFEATDFTPRTIRVTFEPGVVEVTAPNGTVFRDIVFEGGFTDIQIVPGPGAAGLMVIAGALGMTRRRRS